MTDGSRAPPLSAPTSVDRQVFFLLAWAVEIKRRDGQTDVALDERTTHAAAA